MNTIRSSASTRLYVGGLPCSTTGAQLAELFSPFGPVVSARVISDLFTGQSRGFGFVEMGTHEAAQTAINTVNGSKLNGHTITVNEARSQGDRARSTARW